MQHIQRVVSTLKGGCSVNIGPRTVIYGPNGIGKSTILQALELATSGTVSDMEGREQVKQSQALARLFPNGGDKVAKCMLSTGETCSWELEPGAKNGSYKKPNHDCPVTVRWPFQELSGVLAGDATSVHAWLEKEVFSGVSEDQALGKLPPAVRPIVKELIRRKKKTDFLGLAKDAKGEARNLRAQATRSEATIEAMLEGVAPPLTDAEREKLKERPLDSGNYVSQEEYDRRKEEIVELAGKLSNFQNSISAEPEGQMSEQMQVLLKLQSALAMIDKHKHEIGNPTDQCWVCGGKGVAEHEIALRGASEKLSEIKAYQERCFLARSRCEELEADLTRKAEYFKTLKVGQDWTDATVKLVEDDAARRAWKNAAASKKEVEQLRAKADLLTAASKALASVGKGMLEKAKSSFEEGVSSWLPEGDAFGIDLTTARIGLMRQGTLHSALSGAEWSRVMLAIACHLADDSTLNVLAPPDRAWDVDTLGRMMHSLSGSQAQVIVMSTVKPEPVDGWTVVDLTEELICHKPH